MAVRWDPREHAALAREGARNCALAALVALPVGSAVAFFLWALDACTQLFWKHPALLYALPLAGVAVVGLYRWAGRDAGRGNNLILDEIHSPGGGGVPLRMAPLVLVGTLVTHLFGGSAGREGTAVQMGGSIAAGLARGLLLRPEHHPLLLQVGVAAGFGAVFGTPLAGAVFALEVLTLGRLRTAALVPCLVGSVLADRVCLAWGAHHTVYRIESLLPEGGHVPLDLLLAAKVALAGAAFGAAGFLFAEAGHALHAAFARIPHWWLRPLVGGVVVIVLVQVLGTRDFCGLGVQSADGSGVSIVNAFQPGGAEPLSWLWKLLLTTITLAAGFKGGEVTPLFFVGAALGNALGGVLGAPVDLFAGLGFVAVFAGATNTPIACTLMGMELFGAEGGVHFALACAMAFFLSGHSGIYLAQRLPGKDGDRGPTLEESRRQLRAWRWFSPASHRSEKNIDGR